MWLYFDNTGAIKEVLEHGNPARSGSTDFEIFAFFEDVDVDTNYTTAKMSLIKPKMAYAEKNSIYDGISMTLEERTFERLPSELNLNYFQANQTYKGFYFSFSQVTMNYDDFEDLLVLLDTPGIWSAIITLYGSVRNSVNVQGRAEFLVQDTGYQEEETQLPDGFTIDQIFLAIAQKLNINSGAYLKKVATIDMEFDSSTYNIGDVLYARAENAFYQLGSGLVPSLIYDLDCIQFVTQARYDYLVEHGQVQTDVYYFITDDNTYEEIVGMIEDVNDRFVFATDEDIDNLFN